MILSFNIFCLISVFFEQNEMYKFSSVNQEIQDYYIKNVKIKYCTIKGSAYTIFVENINGVSHGKCLRLFPIGKMHSLGKYIFGKKDGENIEYFPNGNVKEIKSYKNGILHGINKSFFTNGVMYNSFEYLNGKKNGKSIHFIESIGIYIEGFYKNNKKNGIEKIYYIGINGIKVLKEYTTYKNDIKHGQYQIYHSNGIIYIKGEYSDGSTIGNKYEYNLDGKLIKITRGNNKINYINRKKTNIKNLRKNKNNVFKQ